MSETIWAQANPTGVSGYATTSEDGSYGLYFTVAQAGTLDAIWFYSPSGASSLPTSIALYSTTSADPGTGTLIVQNSSPSWSGAAGSGWVSASITPTAVSSGTLYVAQYYGASFTQAYLYTGSADSAWFPTTSSDGNITAPEYASNTDNCNGPYLNDSDGYPSTLLSGYNLNWLLDVEISFGGTAPPPASLQYRYKAPAWHPAAGPSMPDGTPFQTRAPQVSAPPAPPGPAPVGPWSLFGDSGNGATGPATATSNTGDLIVGVAFQVIPGVQWFEGYWWWCCNSGQSTSPVKCALWNSYETSSWTGTLVPGSVVTSGALTAGAWNWIPLTTPIPLAPGTQYTAAVGTGSGNYPDTASQFGSGDPYSAGIANGPLIAFSANSGSNPSTYSAGAQGCYTTAGTDPSASMPDQAASANDNYWVDVQISGAVPSGYPGPFRLWPDKYDSDASTSGDASVDYVIGTEFWLSEACTVGEIAYYSPSGTSQLATEVTIWSVVTQQAVYDSTSPSWSGAAGSGWVSAAVTGVTLPPGAYRVTVFNDNASPDSWSAKRLGYWGGGGTVPGGGPQIAGTGITNGPLFAPNTTAANNCYEYDSGGSTNTPPYSYPSGIQEPGQSVFAQAGANAYPWLYVDGLFQNYWVDISLTLLPAPVTQTAPQYAWHPPRWHPARGPGMPGGEPFQAWPVPAAGPAPAASVIEAAATLSGTGSLTAAGAFGGAADLSGSGTLSVSGVTLGYPAALSGSGTLSATGAFAGSAEMDGEGTLTGAVTLGYSAALSGSGSLQAAGAFGTSAALSGSGTLSEQVTLGYAAALDGEGTLSAAGAFAGSAGLSGSGTLTGQVTLGYSATLSGSGTLAAAGAFGGSAALDGEGTLTAGLSLLLTVTLSGSGTLNVSTGAGAAILTGSGSLTGAVTLGYSAPLAGTGTLSIPGAVLGYSAALAGLGTLSAAATVTYAGAVILAGTGTLAATATVTTPTPFTGLWTASPLRPRWQPSPLPPRWKVARMQFEPVSALSVEYIPVLWNAELAGTEIDPTGQTAGQNELTVQFAVPVSSGDPLAPAQPVTWYGAVWLTGTNIRGYVAQCAVGPTGGSPAGMVQLTAGTDYDLWSRILGSPEAPCKFAGILPVY